MDYFSSILNRLHRSGVEMLMNCHDRGTAEQELKGVNLLLLLLLLCPRFFLIISKISSVYHLWPLWCRCLLKYQKRFCYAVNEHQSKELTCNVRSTNIKFSHSLLESWNWRLVHFERQPFVRKVYDLQTFGSIHRFIFLLLLLLLLRANSKQANRRGFHA